MHASYAELEICFNVLTLTWSSCSYSSEFQSGTAHYYKWLKDKATLWPEPQLKATVFQSPSGNRMQILLYLFYIVNNKFQFLKLGRRQNLTLASIKKIKNITLPSISCLHYLKLLSLKEEMGLLVLSKL